jgi:hypothetical protein
MKLRYDKLFHIGVAFDYYEEEREVTDFTVEPTAFCRKQMSRFKIRARQTLNGMLLFYEGNPAAPAGTASTPLKPVLAPEKFTFRVTVNNPEVWFYGDINGWNKDRVFFLTNTADDPVILQSALPRAGDVPVMFQPMQFSYSVSLADVQGLLEVRDATGTLIKTIVVRGRSPEEAVNKSELFFVDLNGYSDGLYSVTYLRSGTPPATNRVYCSADYAPGTLAIIEINYTSADAVTGGNYTVDIASRATTWLYDVHVREGAPNIAPGVMVKIEAPDDAWDFGGAVAVPVLPGTVSFKSAGPIPYRQRATHLKFVLESGENIMDPLPVPTSNQAFRYVDPVTLVAELASKVIVNI